MIIFPNPGTISFGRATSGRWNLTVEKKQMKRPLPSKIPKFKSDEEIAAFMEQYSAFDLVDAGLAEIVPTPQFVRAQDEKKKLLKNKRGQVTFKKKRKAYAEKEIEQHLKSRHARKDGRVLG
jgi:hypothetical protein